jgi:LytS/YehU family sensor histidine kinase
VLQAQVEPHFLFNTLAAVRALLRERPAQAEDTLDALVAYLRAGIPRLRDDAVALDSTLGDQVDLCTHYLDVMRLRSGGRITHAVEVEEALRALPFPPLLLITLVENAVKHGVEPRPGPGRIALRATCAAGRLRVEVEDDGAGLRPGAHGGGLGLENVRGQLRARYGGQASFTLQGRAGGGTLAAIELPMECP